MWRSDIQTFNLANIFRYALSGSALINEFLICVETYGCEDEKGYDLQSGHYT